MDPGETFQCPHGANTWWKFGIEDRDDFDEAFHWMDFTFTNSFSTLTVPLTTHTSETAGSVLSGTPISAFIEVDPDCTLVECPSTPGTGGTTGRPTVVWTTDPAPGEVFVINELEQVGSLTIDTPTDLPEGAVMLFNVIMKEAASGRLLAQESKRFALDTTSPTITSVSITENDPPNLVASATVQDQAASIDFVELLVSRNSGLSFAGFPMEWQSGDFLNPTVYQTDFSLPFDFELKGKNDRPNDVNPGGRGRIPVAIFTTDTFDATQIDVTTLRFGLAGAGIVHKRGHIVDVDADGDSDLVVHFAIQQTGIACGDTEVMMTGTTFDVDETMLKVRAVDEAGNAAETPPEAAEVSKLRIVGSDVLNTVECE
jgi:hypothetical protein